MSKVNLHIVGMEKKFIFKLIRRLEIENLSGNNIFLFTTTSKKDFEELSSFNNVIAIPLYTDFKKLGIAYWVIKITLCFIYLTFFSIRSKDIYLHGLFDIKVTTFFFISRVFLIKCHWLIWGGGDVEQDKQYKVNFINKYVTSNVKKSIKSYVTYVVEDYDTCCRLYNSNAVMIDFLMYESNTVDEFSIAEKININKLKNIQVGNSADIANNHIEVLELIKPVESLVGNIYCILSYGAKPWASDWPEQVVNHGRKRFGSKFTPLNSFMSLKKYNEFQNTIDIALMGHDRQQGMGNIINLIYTGKTVYLKKDTSHYKYFCGLGLNIKSVEEFDCSVLTRKEVDENKQILYENFSINKYLKQVRELFSE